ncbi:MAG: 7-carboxy-7-deazaguanine synthase QueE [Alphaproteobacteria bacterium]|nr:7-carboxy-7-deazaguanine synthase QueE [Alphaproteobacteria bacterium]
MHGKNPKRGLLKGDGSVLEVKHIFATIQGEGPYAGHPAVFIRLGGCNLACEFCDTDFEDYQPMALESLLSKVLELSVNAQNTRVCDLVVITGGEPFRQPIEKLCNLLLGANFRVQIETNGTLYRPVDARVDIVCSPKHTGQGYAPLREDLLDRVTAMKFIISERDADYGTVADVGIGGRAIPIYVQPMDEHDEAQNRRNCEYTARLAQAHGYRLSMQLHKIIGIE